MKRDFDALEKRRWEAAKLLKQGLNEAEVARRVGVPKTTVPRCWESALAEPYPCFHHQPAGYLHWVSAPR